MASFTFQRVLIAALFANIHAVAQDTSPGAPTLPGIVENCNSWYTVQADDSCQQIETENGISHEEFIKWNPDVSDDCLTNFWGGYAYCIGVGAAPSTTSSKTTSGISSTSSQSSITTTSGISSTSSQSGITISSKSSNISSSKPPTTTIVTNATYSVREPITTWNLTTSTVETTFPPQKTQAGQPSYCDNWHFVDIGDTCNSIVGRNSWMTMDEFIEWNPEIHNDCSGLYNGWWVCIGIQPQTVTDSFEYNTTPPPVVVPPSTAYTPTTYPTINSSFTATPTQAGLSADCKAYFKAASGSTCRDLLQYNLFSEEQFFAWNPALDGNCDGMWENYWYCVTAYVSGTMSLPSPSTLAALPSSVPTGQPKDCTSWYKSAVADSCYLIVIRFGTFSEEDFISWNPSVGPSCNGIVDGLSYCVGVPGTPTTRTAPFPTVSAAPTESPMQSGIEPDCTQYWLVGSSDTCESIEDTNGITDSQFFAWNPAVGNSTCDNLTPNFYVCVSAAESPSSTSGAISSSSTTSGPSSTISGTSSPLGASV